MVKDFLRKALRLDEVGGLVPAPMNPNMTFAHRKAVASRGTEVFGGYIAEEYLAKLRRRPRAMAFDQMRRSDPQIKMLLGAVKNPIKGADWRIEPADESLDAKMDAELIKHILFKDSDKPFEKFLSEALTCVDFGHSVIEKTYKLVVGHPIFGTFHGIAGLDHISPKTIERWNLNPDNGNLVSVSQIANGDLNRVVDIPAEFVMLFNLDQEGSNYEGISWLRSCYGNFFRKNVYLKLNAIGIEKFAVPTPIVKIPPGHQNSEQYENLIESLELYTSGQANYLTIPNDIDMALQANTYDPSKVDIAIDSEDKRMTKAFLANFLELGVTGNGGASAWSENSSDFFLAGLEHIANAVECEVNRNLIPELILMNRGKRAAYPQLKHSGISDKAGKELANILGVLIDKQVVTPDDALEDDMRARYKLPKKSLIGQRLPPAPVSPFGAPHPGAAPPPGAPSAPPTPPKPGMPPLPNAPKPTLHERIMKKIYG